MLKRGQADGHTSDVLTSAGPAGAVSQLSWCVSVGSRAPGGPDWAIVFCSSLPSPLYPSRAPGSAFIVSLCSFVQAVTALQPSYSGTCECLPGAPGPGTGEGDDPGRQALGSHGALPNIWPESSVMLGREGAGENSRRMQYLSHREWKSICKIGSSLQNLRKKDLDRQKGRKGSRGTEDGVLKAENCQRGQAVVVQSP